MILSKPSSDSSQASDEADGMAVLTQQPSFQNFIESLPDGVTILQGDGKILSMNRVAGQMNGLPTESIVGNSIADLVAASRLNLDPVLSSFYDRRRITHVSRTPDGTSVMTCLGGVLDDERSFKFSFVVQRDLDVIDEQRSQDSQGGLNRLRNREFKKRGENELANWPISERMRRAIETASRGLSMNEPVIITGETGAGKTFVARRVHQLLEARTGPFIQVSCGSIPSSLFESEFFGYERGSFTGALSRGRGGFAEAAHGGTMFLDEIGEVPLEDQAKLLRFIEDRVVNRIGSQQDRKVDVRIIAATNRDLPAMIKAGNFRSDLFYRLSVINLPLAPLREQKDFVGQLIDFYFDHMSIKTGQEIRISDEDRDLLLNYEFPGNVRELVNIIKQYSILFGTDNQRSIASCLQPMTRSEETEQTFLTYVPPPHIRTLRDQVASYERALITHAVATLGSQRKAADFLEVDISTLGRKLHRQEK